MLSLVRSSVLALWTTSAGGKPTVGTATGLGAEDGTEYPLVFGVIRCAGVAESGLGAASDPPVSCCRRDMPVPGIEAVPYTPRGPTLTVNGEPPKLALRPVFDKLSLTPGMSLNDLRKRQLIFSGGVQEGHCALLYRGMGDGSVFAEEYTSERFPEFKVDGLCLLPKAADGSIRPTRAVAWLGSAGAEARIRLGTLYAALKRRASTLLHAFLCVLCCIGLDHGRMHGVEQRLVVAVVVLRELPHEDAAEVALG